VDGQQVRQFTVIFASGVYPQSELPFGELLATACAQPVQLNLSIDSSGLPVLIGLHESYLRSRQSAQLGKELGKLRKRQGRKHHKKHR
jgi:hypothetical protein